MSLKDKAERLFDYISQIYSIDLPIIRDVTKYGLEIWWLGDLVRSPQCKIRDFIDESNANEITDTPGPSEDESWLVVTKRQYDKPPDLPNILQDWINLPINPTKQPSPKVSIIQNISFKDDADRVKAFQIYKKLYEKQEGSNIENPPELPSILKGWIDISFGEKESISPISARDISIKFEDDKARVQAFKTYLNNQWMPWSDRVTPLYKANVFYDELFSLYQRLTVEGDRLEIIWGHVLLSWKNGNDGTVYHPLLLTPVSLIFNPIKRAMHLVPSQSLPPKLDIDCLINLDCPLKEELVKFVHMINNSDEPPEIWNNNQMKGLSATMTAFLSNEPLEKTNLYSNQIVSNPSASPYPAIYNSPVIFVRERMRRLWVDDAKKIASVIHGGANIPPFISTLVADPHSNEMPDPSNFQEHDDIDEDAGELLLPLETNYQQKEIAIKLRNHFGALVQGPPGTGKSHSIANLVSSLLAQGKRVLVTSQTENALRVLRDFIPLEIRSLCVSQLGNDTEAKRQLNEAVDSIGKKLAEKGSKSVEQNILNIKSEIRKLREEQATILNQIRGWVEIDASTININGEIVSALQAAKECTEKKEHHSWFPDKLNPNDEPPLNNDQLIEMCELLKEVHPDDRKSFTEYLPDIKYIPTPDIFSEKLTNLQSLLRQSAEAENFRNDWGEHLSSALKDDLVNTIKRLESAIDELHEITEEWQSKILNFIVKEETQERYWNEFQKNCIGLRDKAWRSFDVLHGQKVNSVKELDQEIDMEVAFDELSQFISNGGNPRSLIGKLRLSNSAKKVFESIKVDGFELRTNERINIAKAYFRYSRTLNKICSTWNHSMLTVNGPQLSIEGPMPLAEIDAKVKDLQCPVEWKNKHYNIICTCLKELGYLKNDLHKMEVIDNTLKVLYGRIAELCIKELEDEIEKLAHYFLNEQEKHNAHGLWKHFFIAVKRREVNKYDESYKELKRLLSLRPRLERLNELFIKLKSIAPTWLMTLEEKANKLGQNALERDWAVAWRWSRLNQWLDLLHNRENVDSLQKQLERKRKRERELIVQLVKERTWQRQINKVKDYHYKALIAWVQAMQKYGKGTGKHAQRWLAAAAKAMVEAVGAVPAWIMPLHRVIQSFPAEPNVFNVIIVDEASQCDIRALQVLFRGEKVLVVGDPEQISPSNVGLERDKVYSLMQRFIQDIPYSKEILDIDNSLYQIAQAIPRMDRTLLTEHFRCVPQIIEFNNHLCPTYNHRLEPLRQPNPKELLEPAIVTRFVENGFKNNSDINEPEAEELVAELVKCCRNDRYARGGKSNRKRTMGVISLLGEKQAKYISDLIAQHLEETEREERKIICGDAYAFQGDERDVMFLSLVVANNSPFAALVRDSDRQRFNVATSRARDQVFLFHSVRLGDIKNNECKRYKLLNWYLNPHRAEVEAGLEVLKSKAESEFEIEVGKRIIQRGFKVIPQFQPLLNDFNYRIDLVVQGENNRIAVECDGDRWHGPDKWESDQRRESQLRRTGWKFWRISGSCFYKDKEGSMAGLWDFLESEGIKPVEPCKSKTDKYSEMETEKDQESASDRESFRQKEERSETKKTANQKFNSKQKTTKVPGNWQIWHSLSDWCKSNKAINIFWSEFAGEVSISLKNGKELTPKQTKNMGKLWEYAVKNGFNKMR